MGLIWALFSVGLVSAAQLLLRGAMVELPPLVICSRFSIIFSICVPELSAWGWD